jgi:dipeptidyl aminopeptidase/acylaminoacyl peptidase
MENIGIETIVVFPACWSGNDIYFVAGTTIEGINILKVAISPGDWTIKGPAEPITTGPGMKLSVSVARDGRIFFTDMTAMITAWTVAARADEAELSANSQRLANDLMQKFWPTISRDGAKAAFSAFGGIQTAKVEIRIMDLRTGLETPIPMRGLGVNQHPRLSPDGTYLTYQDTVEGKTRTFVLAPGSAAGREICQGCFLHDIYPSNDFALIEAKPGLLERMDLKTGEKVSVLNTAPETVGGARLSPEGDWIAWTAGLPDGRAGLRISRAGTDQGGPKKTIQLTEADTFLGSPAWSPNGRWLYYLSERNGNCSIWARELDPRTKEPLGDGREVFASPDSRFRLNFPAGIGTIAVAADRLIFTVTEGTGNVYVARPKGR